jgi:hypothetical protein
MKTTSILFLSLLISNINLQAQSESVVDLVPPNFVKEFYKAYSGIPTTEKLAPFYHEEVVIDDPTYDWVGTNKQTIFKNFTKSNEVNEYTWQIDQVITQGSKLVTEGILKAKYRGFPYSMRFVNIFHFKEGLIIKQYDYFDNADYFKAVEEAKKTSEP